MQRILNGCADLDAGEVVDDHGEDLEWHGEEIAEGLKAKQLHNTGAPTREEFEQHMLTHLPYREWCTHCVRGRGKHDQHRRKSEPGQVPTVGMDYCFTDLKDDDEDGSETKRTTCTPTLVMKCDTTKSLFAFALPSKECSEYAVSTAVDAINGLGHSKLILRSDQEPAIVALGKSMQLARPGMIQEFAPKYTPQCNGLAERAVRQLKEMFISLKLSLECRLGEQLPPEHRVLPWLVTYSSVLYNRYHLGADGKTAWERTAGKKAHRPLAEFGEKVLFLKPGPKKSREWEFGAWLGLRMKSNEVILGTASGIVHASTVRRLAPNERWDVTFLSGIVGAPWKPAPDGSDDQQTHLVIPAVPEGSDVPVMEPSMKDIYVKRSDVMLHGYTIGCRGCTALRLKKSTQTHSPACRQRIVNLIKSTPEGAARMEKQEKHRLEQIARYVEKEDRIAKKSRVDTATAAPAVGESAGGTAPQQQSSAASSSGAGVAMAATAMSSSSNAAAAMSSSSNAGAAVDVPVPAAQTITIGADVNMSHHGPSNGDADMPDAQRPKRGRTDEDGRGEEEMIDNITDANAYSIAELYSVPRVTMQAQSCGLIPSWSVDVANTPDASQQVYKMDLNDNNSKKDLRSLIESTCPSCIVTSPPRTAFSCLQNLNNSKRDLKTVLAEQAEGKSHVRLAVETCIRQDAAGRYFVYGHPSTAQSWSMPEVQMLAARPGVYTVMANMCAFDLRLRDEVGEGLAAKSTRFLTNSKFVADALGKKCGNNGSASDHRHVSLLNGRAKYAQVYPKKCARRYAEECGDSSNMTTTMTSSVIWHL